MPQNANIVLADSQPTPVNHTFSPVRIKGDVAQYTNYAGTYPLGRESLSLQLGENPKVRKVMTVLKVPRVIVESINGVDVPSAPDYGMVKVEAFIPTTWTQAQAEDLIEIAANAWKNSIVVGAAALGEFVW